MTDDALTRRAAEAAFPHLPAFCTVVQGFTLQVFDPKAKGRTKEVLAAYFTFPGATEHGIWRDDRREMALVAKDDYRTYQQLKADWQQGAHRT